MRSMPKAFSSSQWRILTTRVATMLYVRAPQLHSVCTSRPVWACMPIGVNLNSRLYLKFSGHLTPALSAKRNKSMMKMRGSQLTLMKNRWTLAKTARARAAVERHKSTELIIKVTTISNTKRRWSSSVITMNTFRTTREKLAITVEMRLKRCWTSRYPEMKLRVVTPPVLRI